MDPPVKKTRKLRKDCRYNAEELISILPYQAEFISSSTHERSVLLKQKILPAMFNYWLENGKEYNANESKVLMKVVQLTIPPLDRFITQFEYRNLRNGVQTIGTWCMVMQR